MSEEQIQNVDSYDCLPQNLSLEMCICVLQELEDLFYILKTINNWPDNQNEDITYKTLQERFDKTVFYYEKADNNLSKKNFNLIALLVSDLLKEIKCNRTFSKFSKVIDILRVMKYDEEILLTEAALKEKNVKKLQSILESKKNDLINKIVDSMTSIGNIKDEIENFQIESEIKLSFIKSFQLSKLKMNEKLYSEMIENKQETIKSSKVKISQEIRVHKEIDRAMNEIIKELEDQIEKWKRRFDEKSNEMNKKLDMLQKQQNKQLKIIANHKNLIAKRQKEIDEYKQHKIKQEILRLETEKKNRASIKIQAWWKGTMVRKGFGKFRKKEKKGKKKSSEKKEKKK